MNLVKRFPAVSVAMLLLSSLDDAEQEQRDGLFEIDRHGIHVDYEVKRSPKSDLGTAGRTVSSRDRLMELDSLVDPLPGLSRN